VVPFPGKNSKPWPANVSRDTVAPLCYLDVDQSGVATDPRPILLFDLNGTLTSHTAQRRSAGINRMRPGIHHLMRLHVRAHHGIWASRHFSIAVLEVL
jgi:hypothetical protein